MNGEPFRRSLRTTDLTRALRRIDAIEHNPDCDLLPAPPSRALSTAVKAYIADAKARNLRPSSLRSQESTLKLLEDFCGSIPLDSLSQRLTAFRASRKVKPRTQRKEIEYLRAFCAFCVRQGWMDSNPAKLLKLPQVDEAGTLPFTKDEIRKLLEACKKIQGMWKSDTPYVRRRARAAVLTLTYSGLRVSDVAKLRRDALSDSGHLTLRTTKTNAPVKVLLHSDAVVALRALPTGSNPKYFFWSGHGDSGDCAKSLWRTVSRVGDLAGIHAHPHRFRDTFAVELLTEGADIRTVQLLLGHESVRTTERDYGHFVSAHQEILDRATAALDFSETARPLLAKPLKNRRRNP